MKMSVDIQSSTKRRVSLPIPPLPGFETGTDYEKGKKMQQIDFNDVLVSTGGFGKQQMIMLTVHCLLIFFYSAMVIGPMFLTLVPPDHWCASDGETEAHLEDLYKLSRKDKGHCLSVGGQNCSITNQTSGIVDFDSFMKEMTIPKDEEGTFEKCLMYDVDFTQVYIINGTLEPNEAWPVKRCKGQWKYNYSVYYPTIASQLNWVCDHSSRKSLADSAFFMGSVIGGPIFGLLGDARGRKAALYTSNILAATAGTCLVLVTNYYYFCFFVLLLGLTAISQINVSYMLTMELVVPQHRNIVGNMPFMTFFTLGITILPWVAYLVANWKVLSLLMYGPLFLVPFTHWFIPESVRWQLGKGKKGDIMKSLESLALVNGKQVTSQLKKMFESFVDGNSSDLESVPVHHIFKKRRLSKHFIGLCLLMISVRILTDGHSRLSQVLSGDVFVTMSVASCLEFPAALLSLFLADRLGRKMTMIVGFAGAMVFESLQAFIHSDSSTIQYCNYFLGKILIVTVLNTSLLMPVEILPTVVRSSASSVVFSLSYAGVISTPFIVQYSQDCYQCGACILSLVAFVGCLSCAFLLPETMGLNLPDTLDDGEAVGGDTSRALCCLGGSGGERENEKRDAEVFV